jgi:hypothetical protein
MFAVPTLFISIGNVRGSNRPIGTFGSTKLFFLKVNIPEY